MLQIKNLRCYYGRIMAIKGVSISVRRGELITLIGANGSGKSTLLMSICGLLSAWKGEIAFEDASLKGMDPPAIVRKGISLVPEGRQVFAPLSVLDNLKLGAYTRYRRKEHTEINRDIGRITDLFPILGHRAAQPAGTLSGGEQQMLAIGRALMARPRLLALDEPSMGLAPIMVEKILDTLVRLKEEGLTILLIEQNAQAALKIADRGYVLETGKIVLEGTGGDLLSDVEVKRAYLGKDYEEFFEERG
ncbi:MULTISPECIES: ABC transporter ATP-binding protein [Desulfococcus]|jgi:branched-chain amino acid transport system ATP-binding protein|uniref:ABC transporter related protein n=1 Tax=Desulfococcus multivorans DSM 2059 TaxID=1121405 RepID=S7VDU6_DESML|nr:ABC transporter ATP-binding protein [Desulfococcus multivorans]AOY59077.1 LivF3: high-affinity branched-chain amino acid transport ATP-binding protein [Desulfococcus multivorans]AQV03007.1 ABC transporter ATP-binding protein [Desulfococcus multivorans]EPR44889.1 ABC transporter related protein [Desulfococcus multivorans DSM 2059]SJZ82648.1 amino acid/amide ABC transporter ATP-binding protein 2, HAAT family [Desulfococcus multivorans DSM 2059]